MASGPCHITQPSKHPMDRLRRQFNAQTPLRLVQWPDSIHEQETQEQVVREVMECPVNVRQPPSGEYQASFAKALISKLEKQGVEVCDALFEAYSRLSSQPASEESCKTYVLRAEPLTWVTVRENKSFIARGTTGLVTWQASLAFLEWILEDGSSRSQLLRGRRVLELGSGAGMLGAAICKLFDPSLFVFSDYHEDVLHALHTTVEMNNLSIQGAALRTEVRSLHWDSCSEAELASVDPHLVLGADIVYDADLFPGLIRVLSALLHTRPNGSACSCFLACTVRNPETLSSFTAALHHAGLFPCHHTVTLGSLFTYELHTEVVVLEIRGK
jgi:protein-lysine N-methyltransferase EEF2KMT